MQRVCINTAVRTPDGQFPFRQLSDKEPRVSRRSNHEAIDRRRRAFFRQYRAAEQIDSALRTSENRTPFFFLQEVTRHPDLQGAGLALGRLGPAIERQYTVNGEVAFFFVPYRDFQRRSFNAVAGDLLAISRDVQVGDGLTERFTPTQKIAFVISPDLRLEAKVEEWQLNSDSPTLIIPVSSAGDHDITQVSILAALRGKLGERDLYRMQNPVTGDDFFGRGTLLREATAAIAADENVAILGLRRSGKTSVLRELKRRLLPRQTIVTLGDLQVLDNRSVESLAKSIMEQLIDDLREAREILSGVRIGNESEQRVDDLGLPEFSDRIKRVANRNSHLRFVIALDEVESALRISKTDPASIRTLFAALRQAAQACPNVSLAFSGVASRLFDSTIIGAGDDAVDNPMFGQVSAFYISTFSLEETGELLCELGMPMYMDWSAEAIEKVYRFTGGMPFFVRSLASLVRKRVHEESRSEEFSVREISPELVDGALAVWAPESAVLWNQLVAALRLHYAEAADLLDPVLTAGELSQWIDSSSEAGDAAEILRRLGLLGRDMSGRWMTSGALQSMHNLLDGRASVAVGSATDSASRSDGLLALIRSGESHTLELKETFRINVRTNEKDPAIEREILKSICAFANASGGTLLVGVSDSGEVVGLDRDLRMYRGDLDRFELWMRGDFIGKRLGQTFASASILTEFVTVRGANICKIDVSTSNEPVWVDDEDLFVRVGNQTRQLKGRELQDFIRGR